MIEYLLTFMGATVLLAISPGPDNIYVLTQGMVNGARAGLATTAGLISGCIVHTTLLAFGVSALIKENPLSFTVISWFGAAYLLYLAYKVFRSDGAIDSSGKAPKKSYLSLFKQGVIMNVLNPKVTLFFLAFMPAFIWNPEGNTVYQFYILGLTFMAVSFIIFASFALLAGKISGFLTRNKNTGVVLKWVQIIVFIGIAVYLIVA